VKGEREKVKGFAFRPNPSHAELVSAPHLLNNKATGNLQLITYRFVTCHCNLYDGVLKQVQHDEFFK
jgi:hypothetical protein